MPSPPKTDAKTNAKADAKACPAETTPGRNCPRCPRLVVFRRTWRAQEPQWFNAPVESFGPRDARLLIVGLAPGLRGANRTGRPFTGDYAGDLLYGTLLQFGFARGHYQARPDDAPAEHIGAHSHQVVRISRHVCPVKATQPEMHDARGYKRWIEAWQPHRGLQTGKIYTA